MSGVLELVRCHKEDVFGLLKGARSHELTSQSEEGNSQGADDDQLPESPSLRLLRKAESSESEAGLKLERHVDRMATACIGRGLGPARRELTVKLGWNVPWVRLMLLSRPSEPYTIE